MTMHYVDVSHTSSLLQINTFYPACICIVFRTQHNMGATLAENGALDAEMTHRIRSGWKNWKRVSGNLCDRRISLRVKGKYTRQL